MKRILKRASVFIILVGAFLLRVWKLDHLMYFIDDFGWYFMSARKFILTGKIPLLGIPSSIPYIDQGAVWTWFLALFLKLGNFDPLFAGFGVAFLNTVAIVFLFSIVKKFFSYRQALITILFTSTIPLIVIHSRMPYHTALIFPASVVVVWISIKYRDNLYFPFFMGILLSLIFQIVLMAFLLIPVFLIVLYWDKYKFEGSNIVMLLAGIFWGATPLLLADFLRGYFIQTAGFVAWIVKNALEIFQGTSNTPKSPQTLPDLFFFLREMYFPYSLLVSVILFLLSIISVSSVFKNIKKINYLEKLTFVWLLLGLGAILVRGVASEAYMPLMFFPMVIVLGQLFEMIIKRTYILGATVCAVLILFNIYYLISTNYVQKRYRSTYSNKQAITSLIINDASGMSYNLIYKGNNYFEASADSYRYLLWWKGNGPSQENNISYIISDVGKIESKELVFVGNVGNTYVYKSED